MAMSNKARWTLTIDLATFDNPINGLRYDNEREGKYSRQHSPYAPLIGFSLWRNSADIRIKELTLLAARQPFDTTQTAVSMTRTTGRAAVSVSSRWI